MSQFHDGIQQPPFPPQHTAPKPPKKPHPTRNLVLTGIGSLILGVVIGAAPSSNSATDAAGSKPTVTKTVTRPGATTIVSAPPVVETISTVPAACKEALDAADTVIATAGEGFSIVADAMGAASEFDADGITAATAKLTALNKKKLTPQLAAYQAARDECNS